MSNPMQALEDSNLGRIVVANSECPVCLEVTRPPVNQCTNGHLICNQCVQRVHVCPVCREELPDYPIRNLAFEKFLEAMYLFCPHSGCHVKFGKDQQELLDRHVASCQARHVERNASYRPSLFGGLPFPPPAPTWTSGGDGSNSSMPPGGGYSHYGPNANACAGPSTYDDNSRYLQPMRTRRTWTRDSAAQLSRMLTGQEPIPMYDMRTSGFQSEPLVRHLVVGSSHSLPYGPQEGDIVLLGQSHSGPIRWLPGPGGFGAPAPHAPTQPSMRGHPSTSSSYQDPGPFIRQQRFRAPLMDRRPMTTGVNPSSNATQGLYHTRIPMPTRGPAPSVPPVSQASSQPQQRQRCGLTDMDAQSTCQHPANTNRNSQN